MTFLRTALLVAVVAKLAVLQGVDGAAYANAAEQDRMQTYPVAALRGAVLDRDGHPFAYSVDASKVVADPQVVDDRVTRAHGATLVRRREPDRRRRHRVAGQLDPHRRTRTRRGTEHDVAAVGDDDRPHDRQPEARPAGVPGPGRVGA